MASDVTAERGLPLVSVVIPCRNEEGSLEPAVRSVARQTYPLQHIEIVVVDGGSTDDTARVAKAVLAEFDFDRAEVISNPSGTTPSNLNAGLSWARGDIVVRVDARSRIPERYVASMVDRLGDARIAVAGGSQHAVPPVPTLTGRAIARALNNRFGMGLAKYRSAGASSGPVDTVYLGSFRREQLVAATGWNEDFSTNQDFELNQRMQQFGWVWFEEGLPVSYVPRSRLRELWAQYHRFGRAKAGYWRETGDRPQPRQMVLLLGPAALLVVAGGVVLTAPRAVVAAGVVGGIAALGAIDRLGSMEHAGSHAEAALSSVTTVVIGAAWWTGVSRGILESGRTTGPTR